MFFLLSPLYSLYSAAGRTKSFLYKKGLLHSEAAPLATVSVGNLAFGGSHKTPLSMRLLEYFQAQGYRPAFVSRGYRGRWEHRGGVLTNGHKRLGSWEDSGDEPYMVALNFPETGVYIGKNRLDSCRSASRSGFDLAVLDDAFQHLRLARDVDIVLFDPRRKKALREPLSSLNRAQFVLVETPHFDEIEGLLPRFPNTAFFSYDVLSRGLFEISSGKPAGAHDIRKRKVLALSGIARPERFISMLETENIFPEQKLAFPDHHAYPKASIRKIVDTCRRYALDTIITTEKDAVKLRDIDEISGIHLYFLKIDLKINKAFYDQLQLALAKKPGRAQ